MTEKSSALQFYGCARERQRSGIDAVLRAYEMIRTNVPSRMRFGRAMDCRRLEMRMGFARLVPSGTSEMRDGRETTSLDRYLISNGPYSVQWA